MTDIRHENINLPMYASATKTSSSKTLNIRTDIIGNLLTKCFNRVLICSSHHIYHLRPPRCSVHLHTTTTIHASRHNLSSIASTTTRKPISSSDLPPTLTTIFITSHNITYSQRHIHLHISHPTQNKTKQTRVKPVPADHSSKLSAPKSERAAGQALASLRQTA
jgi:hypothetical protein